MRLIEERVDRLGNARRQIVVEEEPQGVSRGEMLFVFDGLRH